jgi:hypothetical protein
VSRQPTQPRISITVDRDQNTGIPALTAAVTPPSTARSAPVMKLAPGLSRKSTAAAMSSGVPIRPAADSSMIALITSPKLPLSSWLPMAVEMTPGLIELMRAPRLPHEDAAAATRR